MNNRLCAFVCACALSAATFAWSEPESNALDGCEEAVTGLSFSPDGKLLASTSADQTVRVWDVESGRVQRKLAGHDGKPLTVCWSPDAKYIVSGAENGFLIVWDANRGKQIRSFNVNECVESARFSPDGANLAFGTKDGNIRIWDAKTWSEIRKTSCSGEIQSIAYSPDGTMLAAGDTTGTVTIFDPTNGRRIRKCPGHTETVNAVEFSHDGKMLVSGSVDHTVRLWDPSTGRTLRTLMGHEGYVHGVAISGDGKTIASVSEDGTCRTWSAASGDELDNFSDHNGNILAVAWSGKVLATGGKDKKIVLWHMEERVKPPPKPIDPPKPPDPPKPDLRKITRDQIAALVSALDSFDSDMGYLPHSVNSGMVNALSRGKRGAGYYRFDKAELNAKGEIIDAWGNPLRYLSPGSKGSKYDVYSMGPNGKDECGAGDDIGNW